MKAEEKPLLALIFPFFREEGFFRLRYNKYKLKLPAQVAAQ